MTVKTDGQRLDPTWLIAPVYASVAAALRGGEPEAWVHARSR